MWVLVLFQLKHWYIDFVAQTPEMVSGKGIYGNAQGILHSLQHAVATFVICFMFLHAVPSIFLAVFDFITHYHIDWFKMNKGCRDIQNPKFWNHLGLDQMAHQIVYLIIASAIYNWS